MMKCPLAVLALLASAGCASTTPPVAGDISVHQKSEIECSASNFEPNGCKTGHSLWIVAPFNQGGSDLPSAADLRDPNAGSEF